MLGIKNNLGKTVDSKTSAPLLDKYL